MLLLPKRVKYRKSQRGRRKGAAGSGFNAISRDPAVGYEFLDEFQDQLLFGTDFCHHNQKVPQVDFFRKSLKEKKMTNEAHDKIGFLNAKRILKLK